MYLLVENFNQGLDTRRMFLTSKAGTLQVCKNAHINRGGEIEKRLAFVPFANLPSGTFGMQAAGGSLYVFGSGTRPAGLPDTINYQQLAHPSSATMTKLVYSETFNGQIYAIADFSDGTTYHYLNGSRVTAWDSITTQVASLDSICSNLAAQINTGGTFTASSTNETKATGTLTVSASATTGIIRGITVAGKSLIAKPITPSNTTTSTLAADIATAITNEKDTITGSFTVATSTDTASSLKWLRVAGKPLIGVPVASTTTPAASASAIASAINDASTTLKTQIAVTASPAGSIIRSIKINGVELISSQFAVVTNSNNGTASLISQRINANTASTGWSASWTSATNVVTLTGDYTKLGSAANNAEVTFSILPSPTLGTSATVVATSGESTITVGGGLPYSATASGSVVTIVNPVGNRNNNGDAITYSISGATMTFGTIVNMAGGLGYTASSSSNVVTITARPGLGTLANGYVIAATTSGSGTTLSGSTMASGVSPKVTVTGPASGSAAFTFSSSVTEGGIYPDSIFTGSTSQNANANQAQITVFTLTGTFESLDRYTITLGYQGSNRSYVITGGSSGAGRTARTFGYKMYCTAKSLLYFSEINDASRFGTNVNGSGFNPMSNQDNGFEDLQGTGIYQGKLAVLSRRTVQIWSMDADPTKNVALQTLKNIGTFAPRSVVNFGDIDVFFLSDNGVRSLRARDASNSATVSDVGTNIDTLISSDLRNLSETQRASAVGVIEPLDGRYWLAVGSKIYVYSYFPTPGIAAWSTYEPGFSVSEFAYFNNRVYARSGDTIYLYGGADGQTYDNSEVEVVMPYLDGGKPAHTKTLQAIDMTCEGVWNVFIGMDTTAPEAKDLIAQVDQPTFDLARIQGAGMGTHIGTRLVTDSNYSGPARISNFAAHFAINDAG